MKKDKNILFLINRNVSLCFSNNENQMISGFMPIPLRYFSEIDFVSILLVPSFYDLRVSPTHMEHIFRAYV